VARAVIFGKAAIKSKAAAVARSSSMYLRSDKYPQTTVGLIAWVAIIVSPRSVCGHFANLFPDRHASSCQRIPYLIRLVSEIARRSHIIPITTTISTGFFGQRSRIQNGQLLFSLRGTLRSSRSITSLPAILQMVKANQLALTTLMKSLATWTSLILTTH
jgi:hypothetical protein